jgi:hypothetical protein
MSFGGCTTQIIVDHKRDTRQMIGNRVGGADAIVFYFDAYDYTCVLFLYISNKKGVQGVCKGSVVSESSGGFLPSKVVGTKLA